jgi:spore germination cell wall hydrolase CwlJ-like protein
MSGAIPPPVRVPYTVPYLGGWRVIYPDPPPDLVDVLARTMWGEARGEGALGMQAVGCVVINRAAHPRWWGEGIIGVAQHHVGGAWQFDCWDPSDPNRAALEAVDARDAAFATAQLTATGLLDGTLGDVTGGADTYANLAVCDTPWPRDRIVAVIGHHSFFRLEI